MAGTDLHRRYFRIAGISVCITSDLDFNEVNFRDALLRFAVKGPGEDNVIVHHHFGLPELAGEDLGKTVYRKVPWAISRKGDRWYYLGIRSQESNENLQWVCIFNAGHTEAVIYSEKRFEQIVRSGGSGWHSLSLLPTDQVWLAPLLADRNAVLLHSAGAILDGRRRGVASIVATQTISVRRQAAMAAAYSLTREAYSSYREEIKDLLDEKEEQKVYSKVSERQQPETMSGSMIVGSGDVLCFDSYSGRYFKSSMEKLRKVINDVNFDLVHYDSVSLNDLYSHLGLEQTAMGDELGWQNGQLIEVDYVGILSPDGAPAISLQLKNPPVANWYKFS